MTNKTDDLSKEYDNWAFIGCIIGHGVNYLIIGLSLYVFMHIGFSVYMALLLTFLMRTIIKFKENTSMYYLSQYNKLELARQKFIKDNS